MVPSRVAIVPNPLTLKFCSVKSVAVVTPSVVTPETTCIPEANVAMPINVEIPLIFRSVNVLGAFETAVSIVLIVIASKDSIFWSCLSLLITWVDPILTENDVDIPAAEILPFGSKVILVVFVVGPTLTNPLLY